MEHREGYWPLILFLLAGGAYIALIIVFHDRLRGFERHSNYGVYSVNCCVSLFVAETMAQ